VTLTLNRPWLNIGIAQRPIILDICAKLFVNPTRGSKDIERTRNTVIQCLILDCDLDLEATLVKHRHCTLSYYTWHLCKVICIDHQGFKRYRADTKYSQWLILDCDLDLEPTLVKHRHCTSYHHTWHLFKVICKSHQGFKRYRADTKYSQTMFNLRLWPWPWTDLGQTYPLHIVSSYLTFVQSYF